MSRVSRGLARIQIQEVTRDNKMLFFVSIAAATLAMLMACLAAIEARQKASPPSAEEIKEAVLAEIEVDLIDMRNEIVERAQALAFEFATTDEVNTNIANLRDELLAAIDQSNDGELLIEGN